MNTNYSPDNINRLLHCHSTDKSWERGWRNLGLLSVAEDGVWEERGAAGERATCLSSFRGGTVSRLQRQLYSWDAHHPGQGEVPALAVFRHVPSPAVSDL